MNQHTINGFINEMDKFSALNLKSIKNWSKLKSALGTASKAAPSAAGISLPKYTRTGIDSIKPHLKLK